VLFISEISIFERFTQLNLIIMIPVIMSNLSNCMNTTDRNRLVSFAYRLLVFIPIIVFIISASRGSLCSLKFFVIG